MKTLYLVRHAKSDQGMDGLADIDRPLNARGYRDAHTMSHLLKEEKRIPDLIITSPAIRAISTALIFCRNLNIKTSQLVINPDLYETSKKKYLEVIKSTDNKFDSIMLFGHNPIISEFANDLVNSLTESMPTCAISGIQFSKNVKQWKDIGDAPAELVLFDFPKNQV